MQVLTPLVLRRLITSNQINLLMKSVALPFRLMLRPSKHKQLVFSETMMHATVLARKQAIVWHAMPAPLMRMCMVNSDGEGAIDTRGSDARCGEVG